MPPVAWILPGDVGRSVSWLEKSLDKQISQVLNTRVFVQIIDGPEGNCLGNPLLQGFLKKMNLDDVSIDRYRADGLFEDQENFYLSAIA
jgi:hypothetical protein